ncbi:MAG: DUF1778 domain-containing protein [Sodalinema sp.]|uniref:type II toxin-antitoxin system TacA family antitoxin n=1 Tax=Sodalinema sp. TaxID=3080550 RepID=UPI00396F6E69
MTISEQLRQNNRDVLTMSTQSSYIGGESPIRKEISTMHSSTGEQSGSQTRNVTINIRAKQSQRDIIDHAAEVQGKSRSEFMLESSYQKAQDVLLEQTFFGLDELKFKQFVALLDAPPTQDDKLRTLLTTKAPWD